MAASCTSTSVLFSSLCMWEMFHCPAHVKNTCQPYPSGPCPMTVLYAGDARSPSRTAVWLCTAELRAPPPVPAATSCLTPPRGRLLSCGERLDPAAGAGTPGRGRGRVGGLARGLRGCSVRRRRRKEEEEMEKKQRARGCCGAGSSGGGPAAGRGAADSGAGCPGLAGGARRDGGVAAALCSELAPPLFARGPGPG